MDNWASELAGEFKARDNKKTLGAVIGKVTSVSPLTVSICNGSIVLSGSKIHTCSSLISRTLNVDYNFNSSGSGTITIKNVLKSGDNVLCLPADGGQSFFIVDKVV